MTGENEAIKKVIDGSDIAMQSWPAAGGSSVIHAEFVPPCNTGLVMTAAAQMYIRAEMAKRGFLSHDGTVGLAAELGNREHGLMNFPVPPGVTPEAYAARLQAALKEVTRKTDIPYFGHFTGEGPIPDTLGEAAKRSRGCEVEVSSATTEVFAAKVDAKLAAAGYDPTVALDGTTHNRATNADKSPQRIV